MHKYVDISRKNKRKKHRKKTKKIADCKTILESKKRYFDKK